jgi:glucoamylase
MNGEGAIGSGHPRGAQASARVFISYRHDDVPDATDRLKRLLKAHFGDDHVFADVDNIEIGADFADVIDDHIARCDVVLAVMGRGWITATDADGQRRVDDPGDWVRVELETALRRNTRVVPLLIYGATLPTKRELPESIQPILRRHYFEVPRTYFDEAVGRLIRAIEQIAASLAPQSEPVEQELSADHQTEQSGRTSRGLRGDPAFGLTHRTASDVDPDSVASTGSKTTVIEPDTASEQLALVTIADRILRLLIRNVASGDRVFTDRLGRRSRPGCIIASQFHSAANVHEDYFFCLVRDAAIAATEISAHADVNPGVLIDYVHFAQICHDSGPLSLGHACYAIDGTPSHWSEQSDGPALQTLAILDAYPRLNAATQATARIVIGNNLTYLLDAYQADTVNWWQEQSGASLFARSAQLRCFRQITANTVGISVPPGIEGAIIWLEGALARHWDGTRYLSMLPVPSGYDPNIDIVTAAVWGAIPVTDTKLLATAATLRSQWADRKSPTFYPINGDDASRGLGPMLGRYPGDRYDGDSRDPVIGGHPWPLGTCNFAELYYRLAYKIAQLEMVPIDELSTDFFRQIGVDEQTALSEVQAALLSAGDRMLRAIVFHIGHHLELSQQVDRITGLPKSVRNLSLTYSAFLSAVRARASVVSDDLHPHLL